MLYRIAVMSDFHIGSHGRFKDTVTKDGYPQVGAEVAESFEGLVKSENLEADMLLLPGDLSNAANPEEFALADKLVDTVAKKLNVSNENIVGCPGNHDKSREALNSLDGLEKKDRWSAEEEAILRSSYQEMETNLHSGIFCTPPDIEDALMGKRYRIVFSKGIVVVSYNSTWLDSVPIPEKNGGKSRLRYGYFHKGDAAKIFQAVEDLKRGNEVNLVVVLLHHHPFVLDEPNGEQDSTILNGAEAFCEMCADIKADIVVHGHKHLAKFASRSFDSRRDIPVLCAGGFCNRPEAYLQGKAFNQFHMIEVHEKSQDSNSAMGIVKTWSYCPSIGWLRNSEQYATMDFESPFGNELKQAELEQVLRTAVFDAKEAGKGGIKWSSLCAQDNSLRYINNKVVKMTFKTLEADGIVKCIGDERDYIAAIVASKE